MTIKAQIARVSTRELIFLVYPDKSVLLDVWRVTAFAGLPYGREGQPARWVARHALREFDFPEANQAITEMVMAMVMPLAQYRVRAAFVRASD